MMQQNLIESNANAINVQMLFKTEVTEDIYYSILLQQNLLQFYIVHTEWKPERANSLLLHPPGI